ncbi:hypothetical protein N483_22280 [Pseudoalteromonas luteoviolacea NCIMB 1944]|nr:hypothetical protein N483_22280 [Pseudoalteromonas luteoviolacea NCIMB 1944]
MLQNRLVYLQLFIVFAVTLLCSLSVSAFTKKQLLEHELQVVSSPSLVLSMQNPPADIDNVFWLTLKARAAFFRGDIQAASSYFDVVKYNVQDAPLQLSSGYWFLYRAFFSIEQGDLDKAKQYINQARLSFTHNKATDFLIRTYAMEAVISVWREEYSFALKSLQSAQSYMSRGNSELDSITKLMVFDGLTAYYSTLKFYVKALGYAHQAQELASKHNNILDGLPVKYNLCLTLLRAQLIDKAELCYQQMYKLSEQHNLPRYQFWSLSGLGKIALSKKDFSKAISNLKAAQNTQHNAIINPAHIIVLHNNLAYAYSQVKQFDSALAQIVQSKSVLKSYHSPLNNRYARQTLKIEADVHQSKQDLPQTISTLRTYIKLLEDNTAQSQERLEHNAIGAAVFDRKDLQMGTPQQGNDYISSSFQRKDQELTKAYIIIGLLVTVLLVVVVYYRQSRSNLTKVLHYKDLNTGLYNRRYFIEQFERITNNGLDYAMALIEFDTDNTNEYDRSLLSEKEVKFAAEQLSMQFRDDGDLVCRVSEREFVILCQGMKKPVLQKRLSVLQHFFTAQKQLHPINFSGALICSEEGDFGNIFAELESRLIHVKRTAHGQVVAF